MSATSPTDPALLSATELLALYRAKKLSPVEAVQATLARIERFNPIVNAYCHLDAAGALAAAEAVGGALDGRHARRASSTACRWASRTTSTSPACPRASARS